MLTDVWHLCNDVQRFVAHVLRVAGGESDSHLWRFLCHPPQKQREACFATGIRVHILPQQRHLLEPAVSQVAHFAQDALHVAAALTASGVRHDAIVAEIVAASHDTHVAANLMSQSDTLRHYIAVGLSCRELGVHCLVARLCLCNEVG